VIDFTSNLRGPFRNIHDEKLNFGSCDFCGEKNNSKKEITRVPCETCGRVVCWKCADCGVFSSLSDFQSFVYRHKPYGRDVYLLAESCPNCQEMTWWKKYGSSSRPKHATGKTQIIRPHIKASISLRERIINLWRKAGYKARKIKYKRTIKFSHTSSLSPSELIRYFTDPDRLKEWLCDYAEYDPDTTNLLLSYGQDYTVVWSIQKISEETIEIKENWMDEKIDIQVEFHPRPDTTLIKVFLRGKISSEMEADIRVDWQGLRNLPYHHPSTPNLILALQDESRERRMETVQALGDLGDSLAVPDLCEVLLNDPDEWVRIDAAEALGKLGDERAVPSLFVALKSEQLINKWKSDWENTKSIADENARSEKRFFLWATMTTEISDIRAAAASALGKIGSAEALSGLSKALRENYDPNVCQAAIDAVQTVGTFNALAARQKLAALQEQHNEERPKD
jgi:hypothetical protein